MWAKSEPFPCQKTTLGMYKVHTGLQTTARETPKHFHKTSLEYKRGAQNLLQIVFQKVRN